MKDKRQFPRKKINWRPIGWICGVCLVMFILHNITMNADPDTLIPIKIISRHIAKGIVYLGIAVLVWHLICIMLGRK